MELQGDFGTIIGTALTTVLGGLWWLRKQKPGLAQDNLATKQAEADIGIIGRLESECKRLSIQNDKLANSLNEFQLQLVKFQTENNKLSMENNALREENLSLREEIVELRGEVRELSSALLQMQSKRSNCDGCEHA